MRVDTTQNASVTELFPALAVNNNYKPSDINDFYNFLIELNLDSVKSKKTFVNTSNKTAGEKVIQNLDQMSDRFFKEKMENAIGITNYLYNLHSEKPISKVIWGYREKPTGIPNNHAGDIFIFFKDRSKIGVSLKAGTAKSKEPLLNTYVGTTFRKLKKERDLNKLKNDLWNKVYSKIPGISVIANKNNYMERSIKPKVTNLYVDYFLKHEKEANELYTTMLYVSRVNTIKMINSLELEEFKNWAIENFNLMMPGEKVDVPLVLVKAIKNKAEEKNDTLAEIIGNITSFKAELNKASVQEWFINIKNASNAKAKLKMTIRSDSGVRAGKTPGTQGRLGRYTELKLQYSGLI